MTTTDTKTKATLRYIESQFTPSPLLSHMLVLIEYLIEAAHNHDTRNTDMWWDTIIQTQLKCWYATPADKRTIDLITLHNLIKACI